MVLVLGKIKDNKMQIKQLLEKNSTLEYYTFSYTWASTMHYGTGMGTLIPVQE